MAENAGRYSHMLTITLITLLFILLGFIGEIFKHQTRQIRYTRSQLLEIGKTFYKTKINQMTTIAIRNLGIRQTFRPLRRPPRRDNRKKRGKRGGKKHARPWDTNQGVHRNLLIPLERHPKTVWNPSLSNLMLTNIQSLKPKIDVILHYILEHKVDICFTTETWISKNEDLQYIKANLKMQGYHILSCERENRKGGGMACIYNENLKMKAQKSQKYESFELLTVQASIKSKTNTFSLIYRPPSSTKNKIPTRVFLDEFTEHITTLLQLHDDPIILGDINIPWNRADNMDRESLVEIMSLYNLKQHVNIQTHKQGNTLDWIMSKEDSTTISGIDEGDYLSDHCALTWTQRVEKKPMEKIIHTSRDLESKNEQDFASDLADRLPTPGTTDNLQTLYEEYTKAITSTLDKHAPEVTQKRTKRPTQSWYDKDAQRLKRQRRVAEKNWLRTKRDLDKKHYLYIDKIYKKHLYHKKKAHITKHTG